MLAGHPPFLGTTAQEILARHALDPVPPLRTIRPELPQAVEHAVRKALAKSPADRFPGPAAFSEALAQVLAPPRSRDVPLVRSGSSRSARVCWRRDTPSFLVGPSAARPAKRPTPSPCCRSSTSARTPLTSPSATGCPRSSLPPLPRSRSYGCTPAP